MTPQITLSLMVTNAEELATMLALLDHHNTGESDLAKQARAERDEATALAVGWQRSAEQSQDRFIEATKQLEAMKEQLELAEGQVADTARNADTYRNERDSWHARADEMMRTAEHLQNERDDLSVLLADANTKCDQLAAICPHPTFTVTEHQPICDTCGQIVPLAQQMRTDADAAYGATNHAARILTAQDGRPICAATRDGHRCERTTGHLGDHGRSLSTGDKLSFAVDYWSDDDAKWEAITSTPCNATRYGDRKCILQYGHPVDVRHNDGINRWDTDPLAYVDERQRLLGGVADLHPDEDPRDRDAHTCERGAGCCDS